MIVNEDLKLLTSDIFNIDYTMDSLEEEYHVAAIKVLNGVGCYFDINGNPLINATMNSFVKTPTYEQILEGIPLVCTNNYNKGKKQGYDEGYAKGYTDGYSSGQDNIGTIVYTYHVHKGNSERYGDCYITPIYHVHENSCYKPCGTPVPTTIKQVYIQSIDGYWDVRICPTCKEWYNPNHISSNFNCTKLTTTLICGKSTSTVIGYALGCGKTERTIESATIVFD